VSAVDVVEKWGPVLTAEAVNSSWKWIVCLDQLSTFRQRLFDGKTILLKNCFKDWCTSAVGKGNLLQRS
jgi:hypothetical protein